MPISEEPNGLECNLTFADDVILITQSRRQLSAMLGGLIFATRQIGLEIHVGKRRFCDSRKSNVLDKSPREWPSADIHPRFKDAKMIFERISQIG